MNRTILLFVFSFCFLGCGLCQTVTQIGNSNTQINNFVIKSDSTKLTKRIIKLLRENGYKNVLFDLRIIQKGSKNIYITNNNYYLDSVNGISGKDNIAWKFDSFRHHYGVYVWPKKGKWEMPYIAVPDFYIVNGQNPILENYTGASRIVMYKQKRYVCSNVLLNRVCNSNIPMFIPLEYPYSQIFFGDVSDSSKNYLYDFGDIEYRPSVTSVQY